MTRKEKEKLLLDALNLKVGDIVEITYVDVADDPYTINYRIIEEDDKYVLETEVSDIRNIGTLIYFDFEKIAPKKKKGELKCDIRACPNNSCPLKALNCQGEFDSHESLYEVLEKTNNYYDLPKAIYEAYKKMLDEDVEDEEVEE